MSEPLTDDELIAKQVDPQWNMPKTSLRDLERRWQATVSEREATIDALKTRVAELEGRLKERWNFLWCIRRDLLRLPDCTVNDEIKHYIVYPGEIASWVPRLNYFLGYDYQDCDTHASLNQSASKGIQDAVALVAENATLRKETTAMEGLRLINETLSDNNARLRKVVDDVIEAVDDEGSDAAGFLVIEDIIMRYRLALRESEEADDE